MPWGFRREPKFAGRTEELGRPSSGEQVQYHNGQCGHQKQVNQRARNMEAPAQQPEHEQNRKDRPQHGCFLPASNTAGYS